MSRKWNGESLVDELSALLGDTSTTFKYKVLGWLNDVIFDISSRHDWGHHLTKGKKVLYLGEEIHSLEIEPPSAPTVALATGGSLESGETYQVLVTFIQDNGIESVAGEASDFLTMNDAQMSIDIEDIPSSDESLVTKRRLYLKKGSGPFYYHSEIEDNITTTASITTETTSEVEAPDYGAVRRIDGSPFFESGPSSYLKFKSLDQLRLAYEGEWALGNPEYFAPIEGGSIATYPRPSYDMELSFNYYRNPFKLYYSSDSQPDLPIALKSALKAGVVALGYEYRDRAGQEIKKANYINEVADAISRGGRIANVEYSVRDVYGNLDGYEVN